jgi:hypothetical protein
MVASARLRSGIIGCVGLAMMVWGALSAAEPPARGHSSSPTGLFTNMTWHAGGGDVVGVEVFVVRTRAGYSAVVQTSEGVPEVPRVVPADVEGNRITFALPLGDGLVRFSGTVSPTGLEGAFTGGRLSERPDGRLILPRGKSYWQ